jgi:hypothetical protein
MPTGLALFGQTYRLTTTCSTVTGVHPQHGLQIRYPRMSIGNRSEE